MLTFIGDVHGWYERLEAVLAQAQGEVIFVGDLIDRGPQVAQVLDLVHALCLAGRARCILGNHEWMLARVLGDVDEAPDEDAGEAWLDGWGGGAVMDAYGATTLAELKERLGEHGPWLRALPWVLEGAVDARRWVAVHAGFDPQRPFATQLAEAHCGWDGPWSRSSDPRPPLLFTKKWLAQTPADQPPDVCLISGHVPVYQPLITPQRIACDTTGGMPDRQLTGIIWPAEIVIRSTCS